jgi:hypothetical protein
MRWMKDALLGASTFSKSSVRVKAPSSRLTAPSPAGPRFPWPVKTKYSTGLSPRARSFSMRAFSRSSASLRAERVGGRVCAARPGWSTWVSSSRTLSSTASLTRGARSSW